MWSLSPIAGCIGPGQLEIVGQHGTEVPATLQDGDLRTEAGIDTHDKPSNTARKGSATIHDGRPRTSSDGHARQTHPCRNDRCSENAAELLMVRLPDDNKHASILSAHLEYKAARSEMRLESTHQQSPHILRGLHRLLPGLLDQLADQPEKSICKQCFNGGRRLPIAFHPSPLLPSLHNACGHSSVADSGHGVVAVNGINTSTLPSQCS